MGKIGYIRVSSQDQNLDRQLAMMEGLNIDKLFQEKIGRASCRERVYVLV